MGIGANEGRHAREQAAVGEPDGQRVACAGPAHVKVGAAGPDRAGASHVIFAEPRLQLAAVQNSAEETSGPNRLGGKEESR